MSADKAALERLTGINVSRESWARLETYVDLLLRWQRRINLIGTSTVEDVWQRHVGDAVQLAGLVRTVPRAIIDLGAGAGLPGLPLAMVWAPEADVFVHLVESNGKKASFLREALRVTGIAGAVHDRRLEALDAAGVVPAPQLVVARALAPLPILLGYAKPYVDNGAFCLFHKGQDVDDELTESTKYWRIFHRLHASRLPGGGWIVEVREIERAGKQ